MMLVTLGVVYGDIGTSPMYVMKAIVNGNGGIASVTEELILGALSLVIWTITLVTTVKYVVVAMRADNNGEGGIFALYSLVRRVAPWLILPAMIGGAALLADGILTPAVTVTTAIEGLRSIPLGYRIIGDDLDQLGRLRNDTTHHVRADNLVFLTNDSSPDLLDRDILYSILDKRPKRARTYWFINVHVTDEPYTSTYTVNTFGTNFVFKVQLQLGFRVNQRINTYLRQVVADLIASGELAPQPRLYSIYRNPGTVGDFRFCMLRKVLAPETNLSPRDYRTMNAKYAIRSWCGSPDRWYGLENSSIIFETVPLFSKVKPATHLQRIASKDAGEAHDRRKAASAGTKSRADVDIFSADMERERELSAREAAEDLIGGHTAQFQALKLDEEDNE